MTDKPRFNLTLQIEHQQPLTIEDLLNQLGLAANETKERELIVELAYRIIFREMTALLDRPVKGRVGKAKPKSRRARRMKGDDSV
jgi:hypothetical protein